MFNFIILPRKRFISEILILKNLFCDKLNIIFVISKLICYSLYYFLDLIDIRTNYYNITNIFRVNTNKIYLKDILVIEKKMLNTIMPKTNPELTLRERIVTS